MARLELDFYQRSDVIEISKELLGKVLFSKIGNVTTSGIISEVEAYNGISDKASHAFNGKRTGRTEVMFRQGGISYVYLCYGIHHLFNVVTNIAKIPDAVLIRSIFPYSGIEEMLVRRNKKTLIQGLGNGPGNVSKCLGITTNHSGESLLCDKIWIEDHGIKITNDQINISPRIGVDYAGNDALLPYRFWIEKI